MEEVLFFVYGNLTRPNVVRERLRGIETKLDYADARIRDFILLRFGARGKYDTLFPFKGGATWGKLLRIVGEAEEVIRRLDEYEGVPYLYERHRVRTDDGRWCFYYISNPSKVKVEEVHGAIGEDLQKVMEEGGWSEYLKNTEKKPLVEVAER